MVILLPWRFLEVSERADTLAKERRQEEGGVRTRCEREEEDIRGASDFVNPVIMAVCRRSKGA